MVIPATSVATSQAPGLIWTRVIFFVTASWSGTWTEIQGYDGSKMKGVEVAHIVAGILGNITCFFLYTSPVPTILRIVKKKSVEEFKCDPYIAAVMNCIFWIMYALPIISPGNTLVITINSFGLILELIYLIIYFVYCNNKQRRWILAWLVAEMAVTAGVASGAIFGFHTHHSRSNFVGIFCVAFTIMLFASPFTIIRKVVKTKSVEYMPLSLSAAFFVNGIVWTVYSLLKFDPYLFTGNSVGALLGGGQLVLYWYYYKETPKSIDKDEKRSTWVQEKPTEDKQDSV